MNKIYTKLRHSLPGVCEVEIYTKSINPSAANLKECTVIPLSSHKLREHAFHHVHSLLLVYVCHYLNHTVAYFWSFSGFPFGPAP